MKAILEKLITAADNHGEDSGDPDHTVGDLQDLLRSAWEIMTVSQKLQLLRGEAVESVVECGAQGDFEPDDLIDEVNKSLAELEAVILAAGYTIMENEGGFYWETDNYAGEDFHAREDSVVDAHEHLVANQHIGAQGENS